MRSHSETQVTFSFCPPAGRSFRDAARLYSPLGLYVLHAWNHNIQNLDSFPTFLVPLLYKQVFNMQCVADFAPCILLPSCHVGRTVFTREVHIRIIMLVWPNYTSHYCLQQNENGEWWNIKHQWHSWLALHFVIKLSAKNVFGEYK